jgi:hypothetical protein
MSMPTSVRYPRARPQSAPLAGKARIAVAVVLIVFAAAHLIGAMLLQRSSPANPDSSFRATLYQD